MRFVLVNIVLVFMSLSSIAAPRCGSFLSDSAEIIELERHFEFSRNLTRPPSQNLKIEITSDTLIYDGENFGFYMLEYGQPVWVQIETNFQPKDLNHKNSQTLHVYLQEKVTIYMSRSDFDMLRAKTTQPLYRRNVDLSNKLIVHGELDWSYDEGRWYFEVLEEIRIIDLNLNPHTPDGEASIIYLDDLKDHQY